MIFSIDLEDKAFKQLKEYLQKIEDKVKANEMIKQFCRHPLNRETTLEV